MCIEYYLEYANCFSVHVYLHKYLSALNAHIEVLLTILVVEKVTKITSHNFFCNKIDIRNNFKQYLIRYFLFDKTKRFTCFRPNNRSKLNEHLEHVSNFNKKGIKVESN